MMDWLFRRDLVVSRWDLLFPVLAVTIGVLLPRVF